MTFCGDRLAELREDMGMTAKELASHLNVAYQTVSEYENNKTRPGSDKLIQMAKLFNVSLDYLCGLTPKQISYKREDCILLPRNCSKEFRKTVDMVLDLAYSKYGYEYDKDAD